MMTFKAITRDQMKAPQSSSAQPTPALIATMCIQMQIARRHTLRIRNAKCQRQERQQQQKQ